MIKEIALNKGISAKKLAEILLRYQQNPDKIYLLDDMDTEEIVKISYLLEYNFLKVISEKYLSHLLSVEANEKQEIFYFKLDIQINEMTFYGNIKNCDFLQKVDVGQSIKKIAEKNRQDQQCMAKLLDCSQSRVSELYKSKSLKVKKLIQISKTLKHNFIEDVYLSRMLIFSSPNIFAHCTIIATSQKVRIENPDDKTFLMTYLRKDDEKQRKK